MYFIFSTTSLKKLKSIFKFPLTHNILQYWNKYSIYHCQNYGMVRDYNFNYFRENRAYCETIVPIWNNDDFQKKWLNYNPVGGGNEKPEEILSNALLKSMNMANDELRIHLEVIANASLNKYIKPFNLKNLLQQCEMKVNKWPLNLSLLVFDAWFLALGNEVFNSSYFHSILNSWNDNLEFCTKNQLVQMLYYIGLSKKTREINMSILLRSLENHIQEICPVEWGIICLSFFRGSRKLNSALLIFEVIFAAKMLMKTNETFHLISILKCLRLSRYYDRFLLHDLQVYVQSEIKEFNFVECTNFLATFSSEAVYDEKLFSCLESQAVEKLRGELILKSSHKFNDHPSVRSRAKDLARLLWAFANVSHTFQDTTVDVILQAVRFKYSNNEFIGQVHTLIDSLQSLAMMDIYPTDLFKQVFMDKNISQIYQKDKVKPRYQLYFLLHSTEIENYNQLAMSSIKTGLQQKLKPLPKDLSQHIDNRIELKQLLEVLNTFKFKEQIIDCYYLLPHIAIASICVKTSGMHANSLNKKYDNSTDSTKTTVGNRFHCIEVLDPSNCCRDSFKPLGLMRTKLRQLHKLQYKTHVVKAGEIETLLELPYSSQKAAICLLLGLPRYFFY